MFIIILVQVLISEIMYNPSQSEYHNEFIEIYNSGEDSVLLENYIISDGSARDVLVHHSGPRKCAPKDYAVIMDNSYFGNSTVYDEWVNEGICIYKVSDNAIGSGGLSNSVSELISVFNPLEVLEDSARYPLNAKDGYSMERRIHFGLDWYESELFMGTFGRKNSRDKYIEKILATLQVINDTLGIHLINSDTIFRDFRVQIQCKFLSYQGNSFYQVFKTKLIEENLSLNRGDSIRLWKPMNIDYEGQLKILWELSIDSLKIRQDSLIHYRFKNRFPLWIDFIQYKRPQFIRFKMMSNEVLYIKDIEFSSDKNWKKVAIEKDLRFNESVLISKHSDSLSAIFNPDIPYLYSAFKLKIRWESYQDSLKIDVNSLRFYEESGGLISTNYHAYNYLSKWRTSPYQDDFVQREPSESIKISPNPFSPDNDGHEDICEIKISNEYYEIAELKIFNSHGFLIKDLFINEIRMNGIWRWDGRSNNGVLQTAGAYILYFKAREYNSSKTVVKKLPIILYR